MLRNITQKYNKPNQKRIFEINNYIVICFLVKPSIMKNNQLNQLIYFFGLLKLLIHFFTNTNYGLHRDEYLYLDQGNHLGWGFMEIPPLLPVISKIVGWLGSSVFVIRLFPVLIGVTTIILAGKI